MAAGPSPLTAPRDLTERVIGGVLFAAATVSVATTAGIIAVLLGESLAFFEEVSIVDFLTDTQWTPLFADKHFGILPLLTGTVMTSTIAVCIAVPFGLAAAVYLAEFAAPGVRRVLKPAIEVLAGVPTVVYGYFALTMITPLLQPIIPDLSTFNALSAGIVMGIMILPVIASLSEDALFAVPAALREGAYALGAGKLPTVLRVVLPSAFSGIAASVILGVSRAIGETMIVAIACGQQPRLGIDPRDPIMTMTAFIVQVSLGDTPTGTIEYRTIFAVGLALFLLTMVLNIAAFQLRRRVLRG